MKTAQKGSVILTDCFSVIVMMAMAKSKYHLFGGIYCEELEAVCSGVKRNGILLDMGQ